MKAFELIISILAIICNLNAIESRSFYIDYDSNTFMKDDKPFRYVAGSIHSYRIPKQLWEDRLTKMWAAGLNAIQTYVFWNEHEPFPGVYNFDGQNNITEFIELAQKIGFVVILRPGPYVCAEHDFGGLPWWLLSNGREKMLLRSSETNYMNAVKNYLSVLLPKMKPYLYANGGPIISVQVENEYGFYYLCDKSYTSSLRDLFRQYLGNDTILFTTDPPHKLSCGTIQDVFPTIDFGTDRDASASFNMLRNILPSGPLVNSEFYTGWLDFWNANHSKVDTKIVVDKFEKIMNLNANLNFYMFHGGTNFGFSNGADPVYLVQPTSYDYDAPLSEAGDITNKYMALRESISKYVPLPNVTIPNNSSKISYGKANITHFVPLIDSIKYFSNVSINSTRPLSFEQLGQGYGIVLYTAILDDLNVDGKILSVPGIRDRGYVQIGSKFLGVLYRDNQTDLKITLPNNSNNTLYIIVENMGRLNFGDDIFDSKGIISDVTLDGKVLYNWTSYLTQNFIPNFQTNQGLSKKLMQPKYLLKNIKDFGNVPGIYTGLFYSNDTKYDTFLKMDKFTKGIVLLDSKDTLTNLGRYWPKVGPQVTLYTPGVFTSTNYFNYITLIELEGSTCTSSDDCYVEFIDKPIIG